MERTQGQAFRQSGVLVLVFAGHVLLLLLFISSSRHSNTRKALARAEAPAVLLLLNVEQRAEPPPVKQTPETPHTASASHTRKDRPRKTPSEVSGDNGGETSESAPISAPDESRSIPKIDWQLETEIAVQAMTPKMVKAEEHRCAEAERTHAARPFGCKLRYYDKPWRPSGDLLKDMRDPNRPRSSVPDPLPDAFGKLPRAEVFEGPE
jgi:hypothetical protein